jgi:hypothetical protein
VAYESERLRLIGTREVTLRVFELRLSDDENDQLTGDPVAAVTEILEKEGQEVNGVFVADQVTADEASASDVIFFPPDLGRPIVCHVESPKQFASRWVITGTGAG